MKRRDSVLAVESGPVEIKEYRRRNSHGPDEFIYLEPIKKEVETWEQIQLDNDGNGNDVQVPTKSKITSLDEVTYKRGWSLYGLVIAFCSFMLNFIVDGITFTESLLQDPILRANNEISVTEFSWVNGCLTGITLLVGPFSSLLVDRFGFRVTVIAGGLLSSVGILLSWGLSPSVPNIYALTISYGIIAGIGFGLVFSPSIVIVTHYFEPPFRSIATGFVLCGTGVGTLALAPVIDVLISTFDWSGTVIAHSMIALVSVGLGLFLVEPPTTEIPRKASLTSKEESGDGHRRSSTVSKIVLTVPEIILKSVKTYIPFFLSPTYMTLAISGSITMLGFFSPYAFVKYMAQDEVIIDPNKAWMSALLLTAIGIASVLGRIVTGFISASPRTNNLMISNAALTIAGIATFSSCFIKSYVGLVIYCVVFGLCTGCFATLRSLIILEFIGLEKMNDGFGLSLTFMGIASLFSSPIFGMLHEYTGNKYVAPFVAAGLFLTLSGIICYPLRYIDRWEKSRKN